MSASSTQDQSTRKGILADRFTPEKVHETLLPVEIWRPFPKWEDREAWRAIPAETCRQIVARAEAQAESSWPDLPATLFLEFMRNGNRSHYEKRYFARHHALMQLVLGECITGEGKYLDAITNAVWALCEESFWGVPAHSYSLRFSGTGLPDTAYRVVDLFAAETGALLAWTSYLVGSRLASELPVVPERIRREVQERLLVPYQTVDDWRWLGKVRRPVNNWNPWIHSNLLTCALLLEPNPAAREAIVLRAIEGLDVFLDGYHADGGCDEGPSYWGRAGASLFDCLELLRSASNDALVAYDLPLVQQIGRYVYRAYVGGDWFVNFADAPAKVEIPGNLVYRFGKRIGDERLTALGIDAARRNDPTVNGTIDRVLPALFEPTPTETTAASPLIRDAWLDGIQVLTARERAGTTTGLFLAAKGGHNAESHNHNDIGQFVVALDGQPVLIDVGVETYTRKTFSPQRYEIWTMQSQFHNLPVVNGIGQAAGREFAARDVQASVDAERAELRLDIAAAYPPEAGIRHWQRTARLERNGNSQGGRIVLDDDFSLGAPPTSLALSLIVSRPVDIGEPGVLRCMTPTRPLLVRYDPAALVPSVESIRIDDARLSPVWGERIYRVVLTARQLASEGHWTLVIEPGAA